MNKTGIEWCDLSWNPVTGCLHACPYCYARRMARRFGKTEDARAFKPEFHQERLDQPLRRRKPSRIFVCSMADLFGQWVTNEWIERVIDVVRRVPRHTFQFLTKNPSRYEGFSFPENAWLGATFTDQWAFELGWRALHRMDDNITFISAEPMLGPIRLGQERYGHVPTYRPDWVIIGAQTGPGGRQPEQRWVEDLTRDAWERGAAVFYKPNLVWPGDSPRDFPERIE
jgi:protein gp37